MAQSGTNPVALPQFMQGLRPMGAGNGLCSLLVSTCALEPALQLLRPAV